MWMKLESTVLSGISQVEEDKYYMLSLMWSMKSNQVSKQKPQINEQTKQK